MNNLYMSTSETCVNSILLCVKCMCVCRKVHFALLQPTLTYEAH